MKEKSIVQNAMLNGLKTTVTMAFPIITFMYSSRILLPDGVGKINFAKSFVVYFTILAMLGVVNYGTKEASKLKMDKMELSRFAHELLFINAMSTLFSFTLFCVIIQNQLFSQYKTLLFINCLTIILTPLGMEWLYNALEEFVYITVRTCIVHGIGLLCIFAFVHSPEDIHIYALIQTLAASGANIANLVHSKNLLIYNYLGNYNLKRHIKPICTVFGMTLFIQIFTHLDTTMVGLLAGNTATGLYSAANKMSSIVASLITSMVMVFMPRVAVHSSEQNTSEVKKLSYEALNCIFMLGFPAATGVFLLSDPIIAIFSGIGFEAAALTSKILAWRILLVPLNSFIVLYLFIPISREKWNLVSTGFAAAVNFIMNLFLIPYLKQNGAALATVAAEVIEMCINFFCLRKVMPLDEVKKYLWQYVSGCFLIVCLFNLIICIWSNMYLVMIIAGLTCSLGYFIFLRVIENPYLKLFVNHMYKHR